MSPAPNRDPDWSGPNRVLRPEPGRERPPVSAIGGKAHALWVLHELGVEAPPWVVLPAGAFDDLEPQSGPPKSDEDVPPREFQASLSEPTRRAILGELRGAGLIPGLLAVRSSAAAEDGKEASFAGQFDSLLGVRAEEDGLALFDAIDRVRASVYGDRAMAYAARTAGGAAGETRMAVLVQAMVDPVASGVAFSADPVTGARDVVVISAVCGLGEGLVSGDLPADTWHMRRGAEEPEVTAVRIARKDWALLLTADGVRREPVPTARAMEPCLTPEQLREIATMVSALAERLGSPQDVEWALAPADGPGLRLWLLQSRPITALPPAPPAGGERRVWDNSNIIESYAGVTLPLTFSFARGVYEEVYRQFCRLMGVGEPLLEAHRDVFAEMLGQIRGRVYYNLLNWYRALALLPGYSVNRAFMERMMGVRQKLDDPPETPYVAGKLQDSFRLMGMLFRLGTLQRSLPGDVAVFHLRVDSIVRPLVAEDLFAYPSDELLRLYRRLERELLRQWQTPLVNDFLTMIWFGVLGRMVEKWLPNLPPSLANDLLCGEGGIISAEPARRVAALARQATESPRLMLLLQTEPDDRRVWRALGDDPALADFHRVVSTYLAEFGDRCANELKLETVTLGEDPAFLIRMIRRQATQTGAAARPIDTTERTVREQAELRVRQHLGGLRRPVFHAVLRQARARVRDRENLRFERTRVFGLVRRIFLALGNHMATDGALPAPRDVFYLTQEEIFGYLSGSAATADLAGLVALRRTEFERYREQAPPPDRFETFGPPGLAAPSGPAAAATVGDLQGTGCCPGVVRGAVAIVREPQQAPDLNGRILVAERTDPGWTLLFPSAAGLLVQRGSLLSHSAIVARETGLPCIVGIAGLLETLREGEMIEMDGATGLVRRLTDG